MKSVAHLADSALDELTIKGIKGTLLTGLHVDEVSWADGDSILLKNVDIKLRHFDTNRERLVADLITADYLSINIATPSSGEDTTSLPNFGLPLNINAHVIKLGSLRITEPVKGDEESQTLLFQIKDLELRKVTINDGHLRFRQLLGAPIIMDQPLKINVREGNLNMNQPHDLKTSGDISYDHPDLGTMTGTIDLAGTLTNYEFEGYINHQHKLVGQQSISLQGKGDYKQVTLDNLSLDNETDSIIGNGYAVWDPDVRWDFDMNANKVNTQKYLPDWPIEATAQLSYNGSYIDGILENDLNIVSLKGTLHGLPVSVSGKINEREGLIRTRNVVAHLGDNIVKASGAISEPFNLRWSVDAPKIKQISPSLASALKLTEKPLIGGSIKGAGILKGTLKRPEIKAKLTAKHLVYNEFKQGKEALFVDADLEVSEAGLFELKKLQAKSGKNQIVANGRATEPYAITWDIKALDLKQFSPQLSGSVVGKGFFKGTLDKPQINLKLSANRLAFEGFKQGKAPINLEGDVSINKIAGKDVIQLNNMLLQSAGNKVNVSGQVSEPVAIIFKIDAPKINKISPDLGGRLKGEGSITGNYKSPIIKAEITASKIRYKDFQFAKSALKAKGEVQLVDGVPIIKELTTQAGKNRINISGRASSPFDLNWDIDSKNLKQLMTGLSGHLVAKGKLQGTVDQPIINAKGQAKNIIFQKFKLGSANFSAKTKNGNYTINADLKNLQSDAQKISQAQFDLNGRIENHTVKLSFKHELAAVKLTANGGWKNQQWSGNVQKFALQGKEYGHWRLQKPIRVSVSEKGFSSSELCLSDNKTQFCSKASWSEVAGLKAKGNLNKTPLALFKPFLPEGVELNGLVSGSYDIKQNNGKPKGFVKLTFPDSSFSFKGEDGEQQTFSYEAAKVDASINDKTITAKATMSIINRGQLNADMVIKLSPKNGKHSIKGNANFDVPNINWAQEFVPHSRGLRGQFNSKISFSGLLEKPKVTGLATLKNGYLRLPEAGTEITDIGINMVANKPGVVDINGQMLMGKGKINVTGNMDIREIANWKVHLKLAGKNLRFMDTNEVRAFMTPDLTLDITPKVVAIKGKIIIPEGEINLKELPETSIDESDDVIVLGEKKAGEQVSAIKIQPNILIELGEKVRLNAFGLRAKLSGKVNVSHNRRDILSTGSLRVTDGKYEAYGQLLEINNGRLIFNGSPKLIGMDIRATRKINSQTVGVHLGGTLLSPKSKIFSEPAISDSDALAYLLTGHSLSTASGKESALLMSAVRGLGITGNDSIMQKLGSSLGLDDVNFVAGENLEDAKLDVGKRLGSSLYVRYLVGLFDQTQKVIVEYKINKMLSLEVETNIENYGLDLIYEIERD
jgi:translocation and assembly module TamB